MVATSLALSLTALAPATDRGHTIALHVTALLADLGVPAHLDTAPAALVDHSGAVAAGPHVLVDGDTAVVAWVAHRTARGDAPQVAINAADTMLDSLQALLEISTHPGTTGRGHYDTHRPSTCEVEALVVWNTGQIGRAQDVTP